MADELDSKLEEEFSKAQEKVEGYVKKLATIANDSAKTIANDSAKAIGSAFLAAGDSIVDIGKLAINSANSMSQEMHGLIIEKAEGYVKKLATIAKDSVKTIANDPAKAIGSAFTAAGDSIIKIGKSAINSAKEMAKDSAKAIGSAFTAVGDSIIEIGKSTIISANSMDQAMNGFIASTGIGTENAERYQGVLENIYGNNYGESFEDIASSMALVTQQMGDMDDADLQKVVESGYLLQDTFGIGMAESIRGANAMMQQFGVDSETAYNMMAQGAQAGLNQNGDLADQIEDNAAYYAEMGLSVEDMMNAMTGLDGTISDTTDALSEIEDIKYDSVSEMFEGLGRAVELLLLPLGEMLIPILSQLIEEILPIVEQHLPPIIELIGSIFTKLLPLIETLLPVLVELFGEIFTQLMPLIETALPIIIELFQKLVPPILEIIQKLLPTLLSMIDTLLPVFMQLIDLLMPIIDLFIELLTPIIDLINTAILPLIEALMPLIEVFIDMLVPVLQIVMSVFSEVFKGIAGYVTDQIGVVTKIMNNLIDFIKNVFTGNWKGVWDNIKNIFTAVLDGIGNYFKLSINLIIDGMNGFINGINKIQIPDWVPVIGGKGINLPNIPRLKIGLDYVPADNYPALLHEGEAVLTKDEASVWRALGGMDGALNQPQSNGTSTVLVQNMQSQEVIDYTKLGDATADALIRADVKFEVDNRDFARLVKDVE